MVKTLLLLDCIENLCYEEIVWRQLEFAFFGALTSVGALFDFRKDIRMANLCISKKNNYTSLERLGKLTNLVLVVTVDHAKKYEVTKDELTIAIQEGVHTFEFSAKVSSLFMKIPLNVKKVEKIFEISKNQKINVFISESDISVAIEGPDNGALI